MDYTVCVVLLIIFIVFISVMIGTNATMSKNNMTESGVDSVLSNLMINISNHRKSVAITNNCEIPNSSHIQRYCESWNYTYVNSNDLLQNTAKINGTGGSEFETSPRFILYLNDSTINICDDRSLDIIFNIGSNAKYIVFATSDDLKALSGNIRLNYIVDRESAIHYDIILEEINNVEFSVETIKDIITTGYPCPTRNGIILHKSYLDNIFQNKPLDFNLPIIMSNRIVPQLHVKSPQKIPKIIHQTFETKCLPHGLAMAAFSWINRNPDYEYKYYDDRDRRHFIKTNFDAKTLSAYDSLIPGAYRADFWRYCVIYIEGGVYIDIKMGALLPLDRVISSDIDLMIVNDTHDITLYNAFFAAIPKHPAVLRTIETVTNRVLNKEYGPHILYPTGPMAMGSSILPFYGYQNHAPNGKHHSNLGIIQVYSHSKINGDTVILHPNGDKLVKTRYDHSVTESFINKITGRPHYRFLWSRQDIYRK